MCSRFALLDSAKLFSRSVAFLDSVRRNSREATFGHSYVISHSFPDPGSRTNEVMGLCCVVLTVRDRTVVGQRSPLSDSPILWKLYWPVPEYRNPIHDFFVHRHRTFVQLFLKAQRVQTPTPGL